MVAYLVMFQCVKMIQSRDRFGKPKLSTRLDSGLHAASIVLSAVLGVAVILLVWLNVEVSGGRQSEKHHEALFSANDFFVATIVRRRLQPTRCR